MGRHSNGCRVCVGRRVRCDMQRPICRNCTRIGRVCDGPQTPGTFVIKTPAPIRVRHRKTHEAPRNGHPLEREESTNLPALQHSLGRDMHDEALSLFLHQWVQQPSQPGSSGWLAFLPFFYFVSPERSCLRTAVEATAYANLLNQKPSQTVFARTYRLYDEAISRTNLALIDQDQRAEDATLLTVLLLGLYELITADRPRMLGVHGKGVGPLLRLRGRQQLQSVASRVMYRHACIYLLMRHLSNRTALPPEEACLVQQFIDITNGVEGHIICGCLRICQTVAHADAAIACLKALDKCEHGDRHSEISLDLLNALRNMEYMDALFWSWTDGVPASWQYSIASYDEDASDPAGCENDIVHTYADTWICIAWNWARSARIILQKSILHCIKYLTTLNVPIIDQGRRETTASNVIRSMVHDVCAGLPFMSGRLSSNQNEARCWKCASGGCMMLLWDLWVVDFSGFATTKQKGLMEWTRRSIACERGIRQATTATWA